MVEYSSKASSTVIAAAVVVAGALIGAAIIFSRQSPQKSVTAIDGVESGVPSTLENPHIFEEGDPALGSPGAPVVMVEFSDFQCPFCKRFFDASGKAILEQYVKTGAVRFVYRDFPLDDAHPKARAAAEAAECAGAQGKFWQFHDYLFENQSKISSMDFVAVGDMFGLDSARFSACVRGRETSDEVEKDFRDGILLGVEGTPTFFVNGTLVSGALPFSQFQRVIEAELVKKQ